MQRKEVVAAYLQPRQVVALSDFASQWEARRAEIRGQY
jgi:hypothetical protein